MVILMAVTFFGLIWGPTGMLLAVPLVAYFKAISLVFLFVFGGFQAVFGSELVGSASLHPALYGPNSWQGAAFLLFWSCGRSRGQSVGKLVQRFEKPKTATARSELKVHPLAFSFARWWRDAGPRAERRALL